MDSEKFTQKLLLVVMELAMVGTTMILVLRFVPKLTAVITDSTDAFISEESTKVTTSESIDETQLALHDRNFSNEKIVVKDEVSPAVSICLALGVCAMFFGGAFLFYKISQKRKQKYHKLLHNDEKNDELQNDLNDENEENE